MTVAPATDGGPVAAADESAELLASALDALHLDGAIFFRAGFTEPFAIDATPNAMAPELHPGAERLVEFHIIVEGRCFVTGPDGERHVAEAGDVVVVPYGDRHTIGGETPTAPVTFLDLVDPPPWDGVPCVELGGGGGTPVGFVCGYLVSDDPLFDPALRVFPPVFVVRLPDHAARRWVEASVRYAMEQAMPSVDGRAGGVRVAATRLPELVVIEVLRAHLANAPAAEHGLLAALRDPVLARALAALHEAPERRWTVAELAARSSVSRSILDERFRQALGLSPIRYLAAWRMHRARELLTCRDATVFAVARRVGYDSEEAFSRAFKRAHGVAPSQWRSTHQRDGC